MIVPSKSFPVAENFEGDGHAQCLAVVQVLDRIGDKWTVMVVGSLADGPMRFNAILRKIGAISHRMLTLTLRGLERDGLVERRVFATVPPMVEYELTDLGRSLIAPLWEVARWALANQEQVEKARSVYDRRVDGKSAGART